MDDTTKQGIGTEPDFHPWDGDNGAGDASPQDNGTHNASFSVGGVPTVSTVDYPLPQDVNSPKGKDYANGGQDMAEISDQGLNETVEVGYNGSIANYGFSDSGGGHTNKNTKD